MERIRVSSSNVRAVGYDAEEQILEVEFHSGSIYHYFNVPEYKYGGLMRASSKGGYLNDHIKSTYRYRQIK
jgi:hypothetical protein